MPTAKSTSTSWPESRSTVWVTVTPLSSGRFGSSRKSCCTSPISTTSCRNRSWRASCADHSFAERVFFCNSGAEANEAAIKLVRRYGLEKLGGKYEILSTHNSFHGRTLATLTATGQEKIRAGYDPLPSGFRQVPYNDLAAIEEAIDEKKTAAILVEPIQAEGGVNVADEAYMRGLRELCDQRGILLIFDEVQTGMGRTGTLFGYEHFAIKPDIMTLAKALGGGLPLGAMLAREEIATSFGPGSHASTFGGNPVACSAGLVVMQTLLGGALKNCLQMGQYFVKAPRSFAKALFIHTRSARQGADDRHGAGDRGQQSRGQLHARGITP